MRTLLGMVVNELEKLLRRRWLLITLVTVAVVALGMALELGMPQPADWKAQARQQIAELRTARQTLQQPPPGVPAGFQSSLESSIDSQIAAEQYLLDHGVAPSDWFPAGRAISTILKSGFGFLLLLFGWLAAESVAQERSDRTLPALLSRPVARWAIIAGKAMALVIVAVAVLGAAMVPVYVITGVQHGGWAAMTAQVMVLNDPVAGVAPGNVTLLPTWVYVTVAFALSVGAVLVATALGMLISSVVKSAGLAVAAVLGALLLLEPLAAMLKLTLGDPAWLHYTFFPYLSPSTELTSQPTLGLGYGSVSLTLWVLVLWALGFLVANLALFSRRSETA